MLKQAKKHFRLEFCRNRKKGGLHRELALACEERFLKYIRTGRGKRAIMYAGNYDDSREINYHYQYDKKSWKSRCRKRHQWEKHFHTAYEIGNANLVNKERTAEEIYRIVQGHFEWLKIDIRNNPEWEAGIDWLIEKKKGSSLEFVGKSARDTSEPVASQAAIRHNCSRWSLLFRLPFDSRQNLM